MRLVFLGAVEFSKAMLEVLIHYDVNICGVITRDNTEVRDDFADLAPICDLKNIEMHFTDNVNSAETIFWLQSVKPDLVLCCGWSRLLKIEFLNIPRLGVIGYHPSALPRNRGRHPIRWAVVLGLKKTASTFFFVNEGADTGDIVSQVEVVISSNDSARNLYDKLTLTARAQLIEVLDKVKNNSLKRVPQNTNEGSSWRKRKPIDGKIDWRMPDVGVYNLVRSLSEPYCGAHFEFLGENIRIKNCKIVDVAGVEDREPGYVIAGNSDKVRFIVKCGLGSVTIELEQPFNGINEGGYL